MLQLRKVEPMVLEVDASKSKIERSDYGLFYNKQREIYSFFLELRCLELEPTPASKSVGKLKKEK